MHGTHIWNIPISTTFPLNFDRDICLPSRVFNEKSGALSPAEGLAPKALDGITATNRIMIKAVIFFIVNLSKNPMGRKLDLPCPQFEFSILNYLFKYSKSWSRNLKVISPLSFFLKSGYETLKLAAPNCHKFEPNSPLTCS